MPPQTEPHSRWRLNENLHGLAASYDAADLAIDAFTRSSWRYDPRRPPLTATLREGARSLIVRHGYPSTAWFAATCVLACASMAWISRLSLRKLLPDGVPAVVAMAPGVLLALALGGTAALAAGTIAAIRRDPSRERPHGVWPGLLFAISLIAAVAWIATWLSSETGVTAWIAFGAAALAAGTTGAAFLAASLPSQTRAAVPRPTIRVPAALPSRRLLSRQRNAQEQLRGHTRNWGMAAQQCALAISGSATAEVALARLLTGGELGDLLTEDMENVHTQMLTALFRYRPGPLQARLQEASRRLLPGA
jgi:hypothetical protein